MKIKSEELQRHVQVLQVGGLINEAVFDKNLRFSATDDTRSVLAICTDGVESELSGVKEVGVFNLDLFGKAVSYVASTIFTGGVELECDVVDNRLVFKKGDNEFKYLLSNPKVISSNVANPQEVLKKLRAKSGIELTIPNEVFQNIASVVSLITPDVVSISCGDGKVMCIAGKDVEHNSKILLGSCEETFSLDLKADLVVKLLSAVGSESATVEIREEYPLIVSFGKYTIVLSPIKK